MVKHGRVDRDVTMGGPMNQLGKETSAGTQDSSEKEPQSFVLGLWGVRYQVKDVSRSVAFYIQQLGFKLDQKNLPARIEALKKAGLHFRNQIEVGPGGKQIQLEDPDGNPIELCEPAR